MENTTNPKLSRKIKAIIDQYDSVIKTIEKKALASKGRAYGGIIRSSVGQLVEDIAEQITRIAWEQLGQNISKISFDTTAVKVPIKKDYLDRITDSVIKEYISKNIDRYYYRQKTDKHVLINNKLVMAIECKAYTENAMMKRILVDFSLLKQASPDVNCVLLQLESQLGGDYSSLNKIIYGSASTHTLLSNFEIELYIITLLKGERRIDRPIHIKNYYKPLTEECLYNAIDVIKKILEKYKIS